jgi:ABC-type nitrate/sulfonate/bicarbonate transport system permease component
VAALSIANRVPRWLRETASFLPALVLLAALIALWEAWVRIGDTRPYILPAPSRIWEAFLQVDHLLPHHIRTTTSEALLGLALAAAGGVLLAIPIALVPIVRQVLSPILILSQSVPLVVLAPLLIVWFGFGMTPKVVVVSLTGFFPITIATAEGLRSVDRDMLDLLRSMGGGWWDALRHVRIPAALPAFFAGLKIASAYAMIAAVFGEWVGASSGLGLFIIRSQTSFRTDRVFVGVIAVTLISIALYLLVSLAARYATPWLYADNGQQDA